MAGVCELRGDSKGCGTYIKEPLEDFFFFASDYSDFLNRGQMD